jgi:hypothetical protein
LHSGTADEVLGRARTRRGRMRLCLLEPQSQTKVGPTCDKVGHYSYECEEPEKSEEEPKDDVKNSNDATTATIESDECGSAWAAEEVAATVVGPLSISEVTDKLDWFESAIAETDCDLVAKKVPSQDWFDDVVRLGYCRIVRHLIEVNYPGCGS